MRKIFYNFLSVLAGLFLSRFKPKIVAITGSVGKTSSKEATAAVLGSKYKIRQSQANYNNEVGVPLAIIGENSPGRNIIGWLTVFARSLIKLIGSNYPEILILEMGADKPGDIAYLVNIVKKIDVGVITYIGNSHLEFFSSQNELAREKLYLIKKLPQSSKAILNFDNPKIYEGRSQTKAEVIGYGLDPKASLMASDIHIIKAENTWGINFKVHYNGNVVPFFIPNSLGTPTVYAALAATGAGTALGMDLVACSEALRSYMAPPGRLRLLGGIKHTTIIDDTYNAAPASMRAALDALTQIATGRKVAVIGGMAELGQESESGHREAAGKIVEAGIDLLFLVGENAKIIKDELDKRRYTGRVSWFPTADAVRIVVQNNILEGDMILVKGSQAARLEKVVKEIMSDPMNAQSLLVRQTGKWTKT